MSLELRKSLATEAAVCLRELSTAREALLTTAFASRKQYLLCELRYVEALEKVDKMTKTQSATQLQHGLQRNPAWRPLPLLFMRVPPGPMPTLSH